MVRVGSLLAAALAAQVRSAARLPAERDLAACLSSRPRPAAGVQAGRSRPAPRALGIGLSPLAGSERSHCRSSSWRRGCQPLALGRWPAVHPAADWWSRAPASRSRRPPAAPHIRQRQSTRSVGCQTRDEPLVADEAPLVVLAGDQSAAEVGAAPDPYRASRENPEEPIPESLPARRELRCRFRQREPAGPVHRATPARAFCPRCDSTTGRSQRVLCPWSADGASEIACRRWHRNLTPTLALIPDHLLTLAPTPSPFAGQGDVREREGVRVRLRRGLRAGVRAGLRFLA